MHYSEDFQKRMTKELDRLSGKYGWERIDHQPAIGLVSFEKLFGGAPARLNVYITKMTVGTCISHPTQGKTQLFRKDVDAKLLEKIFENPRVHTDRGYKKK